MAKKNYAKEETPAFVVHNSLNDYYKAKAKQAKILAKKKK